jgi:hypothetical protein
MKGSFSASDEQQARRSSFPKECFPVKQLFWIGLVLIALGLLSLVVPIPHKERQGFSAGDISIGVQTQHSDRVSPIISAVMILGGAGIMVASKTRK